MNVTRAAQQLEAAGLPARLMIDCSHANSRKRHELQLEVGRDVAKQIAAGDRHIIGVMIESHLREGRQDIHEEQRLVYGQSITDACLGWQDTEPLLRELAAAVQSRRPAPQTQVAP
jgi:3-deoxy-7-phosphoheptulonate synthase